MIQASKKTKYDIKRWLNPFLLLLLIVLLLGCMALLKAEKQNQAEQNVQPTMLDTVSAKAAAASGKSRYDLVIEESGPGYLLRFNGQIYDDQIYGQIDEYGLEVYSADNKYFVKDMEGDQWQEAGFAELDALPVLIQDPHKMLYTLLKGKDIEVLEGRQRMIENTICQTYFLEVPAPDIRQITSFEKTAVLDQLQIYLWFAADNGFLQRMAMMMHISVAGKPLQINRVFNLSPQTKDMPEGLPYMEGSVFPL